VVKLATKNLKLRFFSLAFACLKSGPPLNDKDKTTSKLKHTLWDWKEGNGHYAISVPTPGSICDVAE